MNTIKPATPLPWDYATCDNAIIPGTYIVDDAGDRIHRVPFDHEEDTLYIVAACNEYPRLMAEREELRALQVNGFDPLAAARAYPELVAALRTTLGALGNSNEWWETEGDTRFQNQIDDERLPFPSADVIRQQVADEARALLAKLGEGA